MELESFDEIHRYLSGEGTPEERAEFERRMQSDAALAEEVALQRRIRDGLKANAYKAMFRDIHAQDADQQAPTIMPLAGRARKTFYWPYAAAAGMVLAVGLGWYFNSKSPEKPVAVKPATTEQPADTVPSAPSPVAEKPVLPKTKRLPGRAADQPDLFAEYFQGDVQLASPFSKEKLGLSPAAFRQWKLDSAQVHAGVQLLAQNETLQALQELEQVQESRFTPVKNAAEWYIALAYLKQKELAKCREQLQKVTGNPEHEYYGKAVELLGKIQ